MSKLEKALEKAKQARRGLEQPEDQPRIEEGAGRGAGSRVIAPEYTHTKVCDVNCRELNRRGIVNEDLSPVIIEQYNLLRARFEAVMTEKDARSVLVSSPGIDEGKTITAINLALTISRETSRTVLLIDADMRNPSVTSYLGLPDGPGLFEYLTQDVPLSELLINPGLPRITILPAGRPADYPADLLAGPAMKDLVSEVRKRYAERYVIFDSPPLLAYADGLYLARYVDGVIMVARSGMTKQGDLLQAIETIGDRPLLGTVLNGVSRKQYFAQGYGYY